uniref:Fatty acid hydroxylase domain-containing protein n=1 Tax=Steinernema glaseri TaxID=37863 RepID=A0A1I8A6X0_9BILA
MSLSANTREFIGNLHPSNLRYLFYLVSANETSYYSVEEVPDFITKVSGWFLILLLLEFVVIWIKGHKEGFAYNDTVTSISAGLFQQLLKIGGKTSSLACYIYIYDNYRLVTMPVDWTFTWIVAFFLQDFAYYLGHRAIHEAGIFWSFHQMHHSSEYYNLSTALRQGAVQEIGIAFFDCLQSFIVPPPMFLTHKLLNTVYQFWIHTEMIPSLGPLELVFNTPSHHRVHHGRNPYCIDRNYGGTLIIWDRLFGTFTSERENEKPVYGLVENVKSFNQLWLQFFEFKALGWDKGRLKGRGGNPLFPGIVNKLKAIFFPAGYFPGIRTYQFFLWRTKWNTAEAIPRIEKNVVKYNPHLSAQLKCYTLVQFVVLVFEYYSFIKACSSITTN